MLNYFIDRKNYLILFFTLAYIAAFSARGLALSNYEFLYYTALMIAMIFLGVKVARRLHLAFFILVNLSVWGFLHLLGGNFYLSGGVRLYDFYLIPNFFRYDNFIHLYASFIITLALYSLLDNFTHEQIRRRYWLFSFILILMAAGLGTFVELAELLAVIALGATGQVGDYFNNAFDLFFNLFGAVLATIIVYYYQERPKFLKKLNAAADKNN
ncbi:MAG: hypothetical protein A2663_02935 [Candidatus Buchananbacteria bacterium RIFCSPHIGHO2_01_FULL_46_12]|uniref:DUF2238 domain-containing protein n=1 Tax=Candidatus Buchananbacteria bacterium RIFCSPHIGHO2_01_FULL_46_12 TaxID=1797536 RepID=A0A1G1Y683_9BACT|nr:MAG: hypothetical protein A2663_02935 [Candidatus Buchananbacteria bacterium RIFCSPHIGHO2_01_FULL_46_12]